MAKPVEAVPEWASDETNNTEPSAGQKDTGWTAAQMGVSDYDNWWKRTAQKWLQYVDDGNFVGSPITITGDLLITDDLTVNDDAAILGDLTLSGNNYHPDRPFVQGFTGGLTDGTALSFNFTTKTATIDTGDIASIPCVAPVVGGVSRLKKMSILFENNSSPAISLNVKTAPTTFVEYGPATGVTVAEVAVGGGHTRRTMTITSPPTLDVDDRVFFTIDCALIGTPLICHELILTYDAAP